MIQNSFQKYSVQAFSGQKKRISCIILRRTFSKRNLIMFQIIEYLKKAKLCPSSETQGQLVGTTGFSRTKVYNKSGRTPWALTLTDPVPEAFEFSPSNWPEKYFSGQSAKRNSRATLMSSYTRLFSSSIVVVAWPVQREHF